MGDGHRLFLDDGAGGQVAEIVFGGAVGNDAGGGGWLVRIPVGGDGLAWGDAIAGKALNRTGFDSYGVDRTAFEKTGSDPGSGLDGRACQQSEPNALILQHAGTAIGAVLQMSLNFLLFLWSYRKTFGPVVLELSIAQMLKAFCHFCPST